MQPIFSFQRGQTPLLVSIPHAGTDVPPLIGKRFTQQAHQLADTDWFVDRLYHWVTEEGAGLLVANYSRYVIDMNRPADNAALYSGFGSGLVPQQSFDGKPLYRAGKQPGKTECKQRLTQFWLPYHEKLTAELQVLKNRFGYAVLLDAHSIRSKVPMLFDGRLPNLNLGSNRGVSANPDLICASFAALNKDTAYSAVLDGRFQGGYITRNYGQPHENIHALQLEMTQSVYMREYPPEYDQVLATKISSVLRGFLATLLQWSPATHLGSTG
jgi:N-formylglutamate amidohydrolase